MRSPVALLIFNRPAHTQRVFEAIARQKPSRLLVVADGPRSEEEAALCLEARSVINQVDWECDVSTNFSETNLGCRARVSSGLSWVFEQCEEAIVLEDDCLPHPSFFQFCDELLERYRSDERVTMITGDNLSSHPSANGYSYYFSRTLYCWGWASWRRAWHHYDVEMKLWPALRDTAWLSTLMCSSARQAHWKRIFDMTHSGMIDTWDFQWVFACWLQSGFTVVPVRNLVTNIGFGTDALHTTESDHPFSGMPRTALPQPFVHPAYIVQNPEAEEETFRNVKRGAASCLPARFGRRARRLISAVSLRFSD